MAMASQQALPPGYVRSPPADPTRTEGVRAFTIASLLYAPGRISAAEARVSLAKQGMVDTEREVKLRRATLLIEIQNELKQSGESSNEKSREAKLEDRAANDGGCRVLAERLRGQQVTLADASRELTYEMDSLAAARSIARLIGGSE